MTYTINGYEPERLFHFFEEISAIPRGSGNEKAVSDYVVAFAWERGLWVHQDELYNVIIKKPASPGAEAAPPVMLQGHLDMVCEKLAGVDHDFLTQGLDLVVEDGVLRANGTTLGGDDGVAVATMLAALDDNDLIHPSLECVFTTQEETGLTGAAFLDKSLLKARTMLNLDSAGEEGAVTVSCAGGVRCTLTRPVLRTAQEDGWLLSLSITGLLGGHSGREIHQNRQNADLLMARLVHRLLQGGGKLVSLEGGTKDNAIPRESEALLLYAAKEEGEAAAQKARLLAAQIAEELRDTEPAFTCEVSLQAGSASPLSGEDAWALVRALRLAPNGVRSYSPRQGGFVVASLNLGVVKTDDETATLVFFPRSSVASLQEDTLDSLSVLAETFGFVLHKSAAYPGWALASVSPIRDLCQESWKDITGRELRVEALHVGLECGLFIGAMPGMDAVSIGPTLTGCHTPDERLSLESFSRFYRFLADVLARAAARR